MGHSLPSAVEATIPSHGYSFGGGSSRFIDVGHSSSYHLKMPAVAIATAVVSMCAASFLTQLRSCSETFHVHINNFAHSEIDPSLNRYQQPTFSVLVPEEDQ